MLTFDSWQRAETVRSILEWCFPEREATFLDVGGYPGKMRHLMPKHRWVLCDPLVDAPGDQVRGSALHLPFQDKSFDFVVSMDVLEHIAPDQRLAAIDEMTRVSREGMILTFPYESREVQTAEENVRAAYQQLHKKQHPWLTEHKQYPLPDVNEISAHMGKKGGQMAVMDVGSLHHWAYLQMMDVIFEALPGCYDLSREIDRFYQEKLYIHDFNKPTYRKVILHLLRIEEPITLEFVTTPRDEELLTEMELQEKVTLGLLDIFARRDKEIENLEEKNQQISLSHEYFLRLEETQKYWEESLTGNVKELNESYKWRDNLEKRLSFRIYKRLMRLLGWQIAP